MKSEIAAPQLDSGELAESLRRLRSRFEEFRGRL
jgi:hypothetical protein